MIFPALRRLTGVWLILTPVAFTVFYSLLQATFEYPAILQAPANHILRQFAAGGPVLIALWYGFAFSAALFIPLVVLLHRVIAREGFGLLGVATTLGVIAGVTQVLGLIRWPFLVPYLAQTYLDPAASVADREGALVVYGALNAYAGNGIGEHLGYLFTGVWTALIASALLRSSLFPRWLGALGLVFALGILSGLLVPLGIGVAVVINGLSYVGWSLWLLGLGIVVLRARPAPVIAGAGFAA